MHNERFGGRSSAEATEASQRFRSVAGDHAWLDAIGVISFFTAMTIVVDANGHKDIAAASIGMKMLQKYINIRNRAKAMLAAPYARLAALVAVAAIALVAVSRRRGLSLSLRM
mmetsp:Transcript_30448/g.65570  ORF Transcript_30448/g.65570 Transcript_30448/m.65570 type:complete len:113 (+) Transcript_30448:100-438(+)